MSANHGELLIVEDDDDVRTALAEMLVEEGYGAVATDCAERALPLMAAGRRFDAIITDLGLPGIGGVELLGLLRAADPDVPVLVLTGQPSLATAIAAVEHGGFRYLIKPIEPKLLLDALRSAIGARRLALLERMALEASRNDQRRDQAHGELDASFTRALSKLWMAFQPIVDWHEQRMFGFEALVRSDEPQLPHPGALFDAAEALQRTTELGRRIRGLVAERLCDAPPNPLIFVNLHALDLNDEELFSRTAPLTQYAGRIVLEVTERTSLDRVVDVRGRIAALRELGFRIAIDDLGAGYSGLSSFSQLEPDGVKLDMSLIRGADTSQHKQRIIRSMISVCGRELGTFVVCEGVETCEERRALLEAGARLMQGFLFGKPTREFREFEAGSSAPAPELGELADAS